MDEDRIIKSPKKSSKLRKYLCEPCGMTMDTPECYEHEVPLKCRIFCSRCFKYASLKHSCRKGGKKKKLSYRDFPTKFSGYHYCGHCHRKSLYQDCTRCGKRTWVWDNDRYVSRKKSCNPAIVKDQSKSTSDGSENLTKDTLINQIPNTNTVIVQDEPEAKCITLIEI